MENPEIIKWKKYQGLTVHKKPKPLLIEALSHVQVKDAALDLGAGALNEAQHLLTIGFKEVVAVDMTPQFRELNIPEGKKFQYVECRLENYEFPVNHYNLISAQNTLPFLQRENFQIVWENIEKALTLNGIFCGHLFGPHDDWSTNQNMTFHSKKEVESLIKDFEIILSREKEEDSHTADGQKKHWHYFDLILKKAV